MANKANYFKRIRNGVWKSRGDWFPTFALDARYALDGAIHAGIEYQHVGFDADGKCVYAGVTRQEHINRAIARQVHRVWARWRNEYDNVFTGKGQDYPAKHIQQVKWLSMHPVNSPELAQTFEV